MSEATDLTKLIPGGLTPLEAEFVYNLEVLGLPVKAAAAMAGCGVGMALKPHIVQSRELLKRELRGALNITREDVVHGIHEAIGRAKVLAEPATEIAGWKEISRISGLDAATKVDVNITASIDVLKGQVRGMSDAELARYVGAGDIIDGDFYVVPAP